MRLTDIFSTDKQIADKTRAEQPDYTKTAAVNRQIRSMVPGQTIQGEIVSKNGGEIQIRLADDMVMNARLEQNMNLDVGKNMTFEVRNNGKSLTLSPLFANTATDANTLKALDMALLPINDTTVEMTKLLMDAGLSVDKNSLQQVYREINAFPDAKLSDIVDLHKLSLPVNAENVEQIASYKNLTHQIISSMTDVTNELNFVISSMVSTKDIEGAAKLYGEILSLVEDAGLVQEAPADSLEGENSEQNEINSKIIIEESVENLQKENPDAKLYDTKFSDTENPNLNISMKYSDTVINMTDTTGKSAAASALSLLEEIAGKSMEENSESNADNVILSENDAEASKALADSLSRITGQRISPDTEQSTLIRLADESIKRALTEHDTGLLKRLLGDTGLRKAVNESLQKEWTLKPEDVADSKKVEALYSRLDRQLRNLSQALENAGQTSQNAYKAVTNMAQNVDFLQQLNQMYAYVQLPLRLNQGNAHGDLYVYTNKKNLSVKDGKVSALLHLDMEHLGPVDVYVAMENSNVSTNFYVQDDSMLDFLSKHMDILTERLKKRGYNCTFGLQVRGTHEEKEGGVKTLLKQDGHVALAQYAFDVRA